LDVSNYVFKASIGLRKRIPSGEVRIGSRFHPREAPSHVVSVGEFEIAHAPVTVSQYAVYLESGAVREKRWWSEAGWAWLNGELDGWGREDRWQPDRWVIQYRRPHHPIVGVTWYEAYAYCAWVSFQKKLKVELPTEQQWERAARGDDGRPFPWGDEFDASLTNTLESGLQDTVEAASLPADISPFGVLGMGGNVQEWTASTYIAMPGEVYPKGSLIVARGGSFNDLAYGARTSYRRAYPPGYFFEFLGFRVVVVQ
jgi:formylglycine-generating enzyme required for sulfatase activity